MYRQLVEGVLRGALPFALGCTWFHFYRAAALQNLPGQSIPAARWSASLYCSHDSPSDQCMKLAEEEPVWSLLLLTAIYQLVVPTAFVCYDAYDGPNITQSLLASDLPTMGSNVKTLCPQLAQQKGAMLALAALIMSVVVLALGLLTPTLGVLPPDFRLQYLTVVGYVQTVAFVSSCFYLSATMVSARTLQPDGSLLKRLDVLGVLFMATAQLFLLAAETSIYADDGDFNSYEPSCGSPFRQGLFGLFCVLAVCTAICLLISLVQKIYTSDEGFGPRLQQETGRTAVVFACTITLLALLFQSEDTCALNQITKPINSTQPCSQCTARALYYTMQDPYHDPVVCNSFVYAALGDSCTFAESFFLLVGFYLFWDGLISGVISVWTWRNQNKDGDKPKIEYNPLSQKDENNINALPAESSDPLPSLAPPPPYSSKSFRVQL